MDERDVRYPAGPTGEGTMHRVGLTRHCLASGLVQLPYALKDSLPEGALLARDLEQDDSIEVVFVAPRRLEGLHAFFREHELQVNDEIELRVVAGDPPELRLTPKPRARPTPAAPKSDRAEDVESSSEQRTSRRTPSVWHSVRDGATPPARRPAPLERQTTPLHAVESDATLDQLPEDVTPGQAATDPDVVERFGSVTVRRLGAGTMPRNAASDLPQAPSQASSPAPSQQHASDDDEPPELVLGVDPDVALAEEDASEPLRLDDVAPVADDPLALDATLDDVPRLDTPRLDTPRLDASPPVDPALHDEAPPQSEAAHTEEDEVRQVSLFEVVDLPESDVRPVARPDVAAPKPTATPQTITSPQTVASPEPRATTSPIEEPIRHDVASAQRAREEALSRAGDLHSRIVRWLLAPGTPVIVSIVQVQEAFDLPIDVARDIVEGILESPPPSLRLTRLRTDLLRVSRITVEQSV